TRSVARQGLKVQRRIALTQALFWPAVLGTCFAVGALTLAIRRSTKRDEPAPATGGIHDGQVH
ncbi:hypothetical protein C6A85_07200, partial [Mycobacterium sp. ITM-2017-0098]